ncbi:MAG: DUF4920 domain-containing protein [Bryobacteraceae bacterium]
MRNLIVLAAVCAASLCADTKLGKPLTLPQPMTIAEVTAKPDTFAGKVVQVKGKVTEVCTMAGCWMNLVDGDGRMIRIKVNDGEIVFPKTAIGKMAIAEGEFKKIERTKEQAIAQAKHEAEESGRKFNPASVKSGSTTFQINGSGAVVLE